AYPLRRKTSAMRRREESHALLLLFFQQIDILPGIPPGPFRDEMEQAETTSQFLSDVLFRMKCRTLIRPCKLRVLNDQTIIVIMIALRQGQRIEVGPAVCRDQEISAHPDDPSQFVHPFKLE